MQDFLECISKIPGASGREVHCEIIEEVLDWNTFLAAANKHLTGLAIREQMESVNHAFRFVLRSDLKHFKGSEPWHGLGHLVCLGQGVNQSRPLGQPHSFSHEPFKVDFLLGQNM